MMAQIKKTLGVGLMAGFLLVGCGQKGPLYHPEAKPSEANTAEAKVSEAKVSEAKISETKASEAASAE